MRICLRISLALLIFSLISCNSDSRKDEALSYYALIKFENVQKCQKKISDQNSLQGEYGKLVFGGLNDQEPSYYIKDLTKKQAEIIASLEKSISNITDLPEFGDNSNLKNEAINFLKLLHDFESTSRPQAIAGLNNPPEIGQIEKLRDDTRKVMEAGNHFKKVEFSFFKEFEISQSDLEEAFRK